MDIRIGREHKCFAFSRSVDPVAQVDPGSRILFETSDCYDGQVNLNTDRLRDDHVSRGRANPATGPVFVRGAEPGDMLVVHIEDIQVAPRGCIFGNDRFNQRRLGWLVDVANGRAALPGGFLSPIAPVVGVIGVAPAEGEVPNSTPGDHGGNLDTPDVKAGATVYLPVWVHGALLGLGDLHALQGEGEVAGQGVEIAGEVTVRVEVMKGRIGEGPLVRTPQHWAVLASGASLDQAAELAVLRARNLLMAAAGVSDQEAIALLSTLGDLRISQIVNPLRTVRFCIPRFLVPGW